MTKLITGAALGIRLRELAAASERIDIAVAWATPSAELEALLTLARTRGRGTVRLLVGVRGFVTHPEALRSIDRVASLKVYGTPDGPLFHTKLYVFHTSSGRICWVGSANLTGPAFGTNIELVWEAEDFEHLCLSHFEELWTSPSSKADFDIGSYQEKWDKAKKGRPRFLKREGGIESEPVSLRILRETWPKFLDKLHKQEEINGSLRTLRRGFALARRDWRLELDKEEFEVLKGLGTFTHFGNLKHIVRKGLEGSSERSVNQRLKLGQALQSVIEQDHLDTERLAEAFDQIDELEGFGAALATRLLLFARPDWCVVVNRKSINFLNVEFGARLSSPPTGRQYAQLIKAIQERDWWKASRPSNGHDGEMWDFRAALVDAFAFADFNEHGNLVEGP